MTDAIAKQQWIRSHFYKQEHKKVFLLGRANDLAHRLGDAAQHGECDLLCELGHLMAAVLNEMDSLNMPEVEGLIPLAYGQPVYDDELTEGLNQHD